MASTATAAAAASTASGSATGSATAAKHVLSSYEHLEVIGKGSFGTVSRVRRRSDGRILVWKELNYGHMREKEKQLVVSEVNILRELRHPFIVRYYDRIIDKASTKLYIVMEHCEGGDLGRIIKKCKKDRAWLDEQLIWKFFSQIVLALKECHRRTEKGVCKPILHRDLKPGNIFLDSHRNIKVGDFGLAKELTSQSKFATTNVGTPFYMSPEMINELKYNEKSDIWAVGCLLYELAALRPPFEATNHVALAVKINAGRFPRLPSQYSDDLYRAIRWMLQTSQAKRPSVQELERLPQIRKFSLEATAAVRECQMQHSYNSRMRAVAAREEAVKRKEKELAAKEKKLAALSEDLNRRAAALQAAEAAQKAAATAAATAAAVASSAATMAADGHYRHRRASSENVASGFAKPLTVDTSAKPASKDKRPSTVPHRVLAARNATAGTRSAATRYYSKTAAVTAAAAVAPPPVPVPAAPVQGVTTGRQHSFPDYGVAPVPRTRR